MGASAVELSTARTNVRYMLDEPNAIEWSDAQLNFYINEGCKDIARNAESLQSISTINGVIDQQNYNAPSDVYRIYKIEFLPTDADTNYTLEYRGLQEMDQIWGTQKTWPSSWPLFYTLWFNPAAQGSVSLANCGAVNGSVDVTYTGSVVGLYTGQGISGTDLNNQTIATIQPGTGFQLAFPYTGTTGTYTFTATSPGLQFIVYPVLAQAGVFSVYYYRQVVNAVADTDTIDCLPQWEATVYDYAVYRALRQDADPRWQDQYNLYTENLADLIDKSRAFTDQANFFATGQQALPAWLTGSDYY